MDKLISVIVPVYGVEKYLDKCINSIISQTYSNLEIILVDDESPDRSGIICDKWAALDSRIKVIHQKNAGAGAARNVALRLVKGDFISFVDSDDYLAFNMFETLLGHFDSETDIVECDFILTEDNDELFENDIVGECKYFTNEDAMKEHVSDHYFRQLIWNKLYRRKCVEGIFFPEGKKIDDEFWMYEVLGKAKKLIHCNEKLYAYRQQEGSVMHNLEPENRIQAIEAKICRHQYIKKNYPNLVQKSYECVVMTCLYQFQKVCESGNEKEVKDMLEYCENAIKKEQIEKEEQIIKFNKKQFWIFLAKRSLMFTGKLRNFLKIGL